METIVATLRAWGPAGVMLLAVLDSMGIPVVGGVDALLIWIAVQNPKQAYAAASMGILGSLIGSLVLFAIARRGGEAYLHKHTISARGARFKRWFLEYGLLTVFIPALIPIPLPLKVFVIAAGALGVNPAVFIGVLALARVPRYFGLAYMGRTLGADTIPYLTHHVFLLLGISAALFAVLYVLIKLIDRRRKLRQIVSE